MLSVNQISKVFETTTILSRVSFTVNAGERAAMIGPNGSGKSTLIQIIAGRLQPSEGQIRWTPASLNVQYIPQMREFAPNATMETVMYPYLNEEDAQQEIERLAALLAQSPENPDLIQRFDEALNKVNQTIPDMRKTKQLLTELQLDHFPLTTPVSQLSGGQQTRLLLVKTLISRPDFLLLDEPTNDLDKETIEWLETKLKKFEGGMLVISHDRVFINRIATKILEISPEKKQISEYDGDYDQWIQAKKNEWETVEAAWVRRNQEISKLKNAIALNKSNAQYRKGGKADDRFRFAKNFFGDRSLKTMKRATSLEKRLENLVENPTYQKPERRWTMKIDFSKTVKTRGDALILDELSIGYQEKTIVKSMNLRLPAGKIFLLTGANGVGKSTLFRTLMGEISPRSGSYRFGSSIRVGFQPQGELPLFFHQTPLKTIEALYPMNETEVRRFLSYYLFTGEESLLPLNALSNGQKARLMLACFELQGVNFLLLDEPLNHLDIPAREQFEQALINFPGTTLAIVHDRFFAERVADHIINMESEKLNWIR